MSGRPLGPEGKAAICYRLEGWKDGWIGGLSENWKQPTSDQWFRAFRGDHCDLTRESRRCCDGDEERRPPGWTYTPLAVAWLNVDLLKDQQMRGAITAAQIESAKNSGHYQCFAGQSRRAYRYEGWRDRLYWHEAWKDRFIATQFVSFRGSIRERLS